MESGAENSPRRRKGQKQEAESHDGHSHAIDKAIKAHLVHLCRDDYGERARHDSGNIQKVSQVDVSCFRWGEESFHDAERDSEK